MNVTPYFINFLWVNYEYISLPEIRKISGLVSKSKISSQFCTVTQHSSKYSLLGHQYHTVSYFSIIGLLELYNRNTVEALRLTVFNHLNRVGMMSSQIFLDEGNEVNVSQVRAVEWRW